MEKRCPKCGRLNSRWPQVLMGIAFWVPLMLWQYDRLRKYDWVSSLAILTFIVASAALEMRNGSKHRDGAEPSQEGLSSVKN